MNKASRKGLSRMRNLLMRFQNLINVFPEGVAYRDLSCTNTDKVSFDCCDLRYCHKEGFVSTYKSANREFCLDGL